jgi:hypothetical protein
MAKKLILDPIWAPRALQPKSLYLDSSGMELNQKRGISILNSKKKSTWDRMELTRGPIGPTRGPRNHSHCN